jgi:hypothetical protein
LNFQRSPLILWLLYRLQTWPWCCSMYLARHWYKVDIRLATVHLPMGHQPWSASFLSTSLHVWHENVDWLNKISVVYRNDWEELASVYEVGLYAILCRKLVQCQKDSRAHTFVFKSFFQWCQRYDAPGLLSNDFFWNKTDALALSVCLQWWV